MLMFFKICDYILIFAFQSSHCLTLKRVAAHRLHVSFFTLKHTHCICICVHTYLYIFAYDDCVKTWTEKNFPLIISLMKYLMSPARCLFVHTCIELPVYAQECMQYQIIISVQSLVFFYLPVLTLRCKTFCFPMTCKISIFF